jgi:diguanylate cyclase (GGDEF)-like protein
MSTDGASELPTNANSDIGVSPTLSARGLRRTLSRAKIVEGERRLNRPNEDPAITRKHAVAIAAIETTKYLALVDPLTGLHNREWLEDDLDRRIASAERSGSPLYVIFGDFDNFKDYNSAYGHAGGDEVIKLVSAIQTRPDEPFCRYAGDEFLQSMEHEGLNPQEIGLAIKRYQDIILEKSKIFLEKLPVIAGVDPTKARREVCLSFGVAKYEGESRDDLIKKANLAMHHAKTVGKNNAFIAEKSAVDSGYSFIQIN